MKKIGWIGLGKFGLPIAQCCLDAGYQVIGFSVNGRGETGINKLLAHENGKRGIDMSTLDLLILCLPHPNDVEEVLNHFEEQLPSIIIDLSTGNPEDTQIRSEYLRNRGITLIDCPVSGSEEAARLGKLTVFVGGEENSNNKVDAFLHTIGDHIFYFGQSGKGHEAKLINQFVHISIMGVIGDGLHLAKQIGLDQSLIVQAMKTSSANSAMLSRFGESIVNKDYTPQFTLELASKDISLVSNLIDQHQLDLPYQKVTQESLEEKMDLKLGNMNFSIICERS